MEYMVVHSTEDMVEIIKFEMENIQMIQDKRDVINMINCKMETNLKCRLLLILMLTDAEDIRCLI